MRYSLMMALVVLCAVTAARGVTPIYSFETLYNNTDVVDPAGTRPDGFHANGGGTVVARDTIGTTEGAYSIRFTQVGGQTFSGGLTAVLDPAINDPGTIGLVFDVTVPATGQFAGNFARMGIMEFGDNESQGILGGQGQTTSAAEANISLAPGVYHVTIPLISRGNPITFDPNVPFSSMFGDDPNTQLVPTGFQFYVNKSSDSALAIYVDNVRVALNGDIDGDGVITPDDYALIDRGILRTYPIDSPPGWINGDLNTDGQVDANDYLILDTAFVEQGGVFSAGDLADREGRFGEEYVAELLAGVPEPSGVGVGGMMAAYAIGRRHRVIRTRRGGGR